MIRQPYVVRPEPGLAQTLLSALAATWAGSLASALLLTVLGDGPAATAGRIAAATIVGAVVLAPVVRILAGAAVSPGAAVAALAAGNIAAYGSRALFGAPSSPDDAVPSIGAISAFLIGVGVCWWLVRAAAEPVSRSRPLVLAGSHATTFGWLSLALAVAVAVIGIGVLAQRGLALRPAAHAYDDRLESAQATTVRLLRAVDADRSVRRAQTAIRRQAAALARTEAPPTAQEANADLVRSLHRLAADLPGIARARPRHRLKVLLPDWQRVHAAFAHLDRLGYGDLDAAGWTSLLQPRARR